MRLQWRGCGSVVLAVCTAPCRVCRVACCRLACCRRAGLLLRQLTYNEFADTAYVVDVALAPAFWFVDNYVQYFGPLFVAFLISMVGAVIFLTYAVVVPYEIARKPVWESCLYLLLGNWLLINFAFNYFMAFRTDAGSPPRNKNTAQNSSKVVEQVSGMCRKCMAPKPPRTHHCSVCGRCVLKMDHHCPWLSQCVGHYNHRYFFLTMFYMAVGCFVMNVGMYPAFSEHFWGQGEYAPWCRAMEERLSYSWLLCDRRLNIHNIPFLGGPDPAAPPHFPLDGEGTTTTLSEAEEERLNYAPKFDTGMNAYNCIMFQFLASLAIVAGVGGLASWHAYLITMGETTVEQYVNKDASKKFKQDGRVYRNPYDFGWRENWRIFLGIDRKGISLWRHILLPSTHTPDGDGMTWRTNPYYQTANDPTSGFTVPTGVVVEKQV